MFDNVPKEAYWTLPLIIAILGYFLRDAHSKINAAIDKHGLELSKKLDEDRYNAAKAEAKLEIEALKRDSKEARRWQYVSDWFAVSSFFTPVHFWLG